jgi:hypothetical protein
MSQEQMPLMSLGADVIGQMPLWGIIRVNAICVTHEYVYYRQCHFKQLTP